MVIRRFAAAPACDAVPGMQARGAVLLMRHRARFCLRAPPLWPVPREGAVSRSCRSHARPPWRRMSFRQLTREYGVTATAVHTVMWLATLGATYGALANGVDVKSLIAKLDMVPGVDSSKINPDAGTFVAAYVITSLSGPVRGGLTLMVTPAVARVLVRTFPAYARRSRYGKGPQPPGSQRPQGSRDVKDKS